MTTGIQGSAPAGSTVDPGAGDGSTSNAEVTKLQEALTASKALVDERDGALEAANKSVADLQAANKKFADDVAGLANQGQQLKDAQSALEESRKTTTDLQTQLEQANASRTELQAHVVTRRRQDLVTRYGVPEERVAELDDAGLTVLESTLPHLPAGQSNKPPGGDQSNPGGGTGYGLNSGAGATDLSSLTDSEKARRTIERLKSPN